jgi:hypothetical protein
MLVVGESGGQEQVVRTIVGLWPWGSGEILVRFEELFLTPQEPRSPEIHDTSRPSTQLNAPANTRVREVVAQE